MLRSAQHDSAANSHDEPAGTIHAAARSRQHYPPEGPPTRTSGRPRMGSRLWRVREPDRVGSEGQRTGPMDPITIVLVDDHCIVREGLRAMLETDPQLQVVGEAADGQEALERVAELQPAVVLMDIRMPAMAAWGAPRRLKREHPHVAVIVISGYDDSELVLDALRAGAVGY